MSRKLSESRRLKEVMSWRFITELHRRFPKRFQIIEAHPGGGMYDCLTLIDKQRQESVIDVNRQGSVHVLLEHSDIWSNWLERMLAEDSKDFLDEVTRVARLKIPNKLPPTTPESLVYRFISDFLSHSINQREYWECRNGFFDTSSISPSSIRAEWYELFPNAKSRLDELVRRNDSDLPAYQFWFLLRDEKPKLCLEFSGTAYRLDGKSIDLMPLYKQYRRIWPIISEVALDLLP